MPCSEEDRYDFEIQQGDDESVTFRWLADDLPVDVAGKNFVFECALPSLTHNMTVATPTTLGEFTANFDRADTAGLSYRRVGYEVVVWEGAVDASPKETLFWGSINLKPERVV